MIAPRMLPHSKIDGVARDPKEEADLNALAARVLVTPEGRKLMAYLRSVTIEFVQGPVASDAELRHLEGQRYLVALLERRIANAQRRPAAPRSRRRRSAAAVEPAPAAARG